jgi:hypothetical protein
MDADTQQFLPIAAVLVAVVITGIAAYFAL